MEGRSTGGGDRKLEMERLTLERLKLEKLGSHWEAK